MKMARAAVIIALLIIGVVAVRTATAGTPAHPYRPFLDPLDLHDLWWWTLVPLAIGISLAYKAIRVPSFDTYWREVLIMSVQIVAGMAAIAAGLYLLIEVAVPLLT